MRSVASFLFLAAATAQLAWGLSAAGWRQQSIYQVMTDRFARTDLSTTAACDTSAQAYCGGTYQGLISKLDYIQGMGFTAVWISPIVKQMDGNTADGSSYHGYWAQDIWSLNPSFGTAGDLMALSTALHARGMYLMLDVVTNHVAYKGCGACVDYSIFTPFDSASYFHPFCLIDYSNQTSIEQCWEGDNTVSLPDLRTEDSSVRAIWNDWIAQIVETYGIDGLRVDSVKHQETSFWSGFGAAAGVFMLGEVYNGDPTQLAAYQDYMPGLLDYASYYWITRAFQSSSGSIGDLAAGVNTLKGVARNTSLYGSFLENHDQPRFASLTSDLALAKNAIAFTMLKDGIPVVYQGQEQHFAGGSVPADREALWSSGYDTSATLYAWIAALNKIRARAIAQDGGYLSYQAYPVYTDSNTIAMRKGRDGYQVVGVFTNKGSSGGSSSVTLTASMTGFTAGQAVVDVMSCTTFTADSGGSLGVTLSGGIPRVFYPSARLSGSGICGSGSTTSTSTGTSSTTKTGTGTTLTTSTKTTASSTSTKSEFTGLDPLRVYLLLTIPQAAVPAPPRQWP